MRPVWDIAVNQLDCPFGQTRALGAASSVPSPLSDIIRAPKALISDWLAPAGCLQYHVQPTGQIESFNFNNGAGQCHEGFLIIS